MNIYKLPYKPSLVNEYILHFASQAISTGCFSYFKQQPKLYSFAILLIGRMRTVIP